MGRISSPQGKGSLLHNRRDYEKYGMEIPSHIDRERMSENVTLVDRDIKELYREVFGEAIDEYNRKQKRADRRIDDYLEHLKKSKNGEKLFYEDVIQWGSKEDFENSPEMRQKACEALKLYVNSFEKRNPNLKLLGAYIHMDEASPHLHLDYVPVAHGYKSGLSARNSLNKALKEMGFQPEKESKRNNATMLWKESEREAFAKCCVCYDLEVEPERKARGSLSVDEYKEAKDKMMGAIEQELEQTKKELATNSVALDQQAELIEQNTDKIKKLDLVTSYIAQNGDEAYKVENMTIPERKSFLGRVEAPERKGIFIQGMEQEQFKALTQRVRADDGLERSIQEAHQEAAAIKEKGKEEARTLLDGSQHTIDQAKQIIQERDSIIERAKKWAKELTDKYNDLAKRFNELLGRKNELQAEVDRIEAYKGKLEPLRAEYEDLSKAVDIMSGKLDNELTQAKFRDISTFGFHEDYWGYRDRGELLALYKDGTTRIVGSNENGGFDNKTLEDNKKGLCRVGIMQTEERVRVPKSLVQELIANRDRSKPITTNLANFIDQQTKVKDVTRNRGRGR